VVSYKFTLYNVHVSGFSLPPINTVCHHITEKLLSMAKNDKQTNILLPLDFFIVAQQKGGTSNKDTIV
jgi:hypothetical protein